MSAPRSAHERLAEIQRLTRTRVALVRVLRRYFTAAELGDMFEALPDGGSDSQPLSTLIEAIGTAWSEEDAAAKRAARPGAVTE